MQREDVERLIEKLMEAEYSPEVIYQDEDKYHLPADAAIALGALLDRAEKAEAERDAAFAAGQESMRERAAAELAGWADLLATAGMIEEIRALPIKPHP